MVIKSLSTNAVPVYTLKSSNGSKDQGKVAGMSLKVLGIMTGTSCDGLDAACMDIDSEGWQPLWTASLPYPASLRKRVLAFQEKKALHSNRTHLELHRDLGDWYGSAIAKLIQKNEIK